MELVTKKIFTGIGIVALALFLSNRILFFSYGTLERVATSITYPVILVTKSCANGLKSIADRKLRYQELEQKYQQVKNLYLAVLDENIKLKATMRYDFLSKELREFQQRYNLEHLPLAKVLVKNITDDEHYLLINKGAKDGVNKNMTALYKFQIVGKVTDVFEHYSKVILITDQSCKVAAYTSQTNAQGIVRGLNDINRCVMNYVSHLSTIIDKDIILSSGQGLVFPEGFCLGKIIKHELKEKSLYHDLEIEPLLNLEALEFCLLTDQTPLKLT